MIMKSASTVEQAPPGATSASDASVPRRTRIALVGTLSSLADEPIGYELAELRRLVENLEPDLLGIEADPAAFERGAPDHSREIREALLPAARLTDVVVVPLGAPAGHEFEPPAKGSLAGARSMLIRTADRLLISMARSVDSPAAASRGTYIHLCELICHVESAAADDAGRRAWDEANELILRRLIDAVRRDPGRRVLVAVQCRRIHWLTARLRRLADDFDLVPFEELHPARPARAWS